MEMESHGEKEPLKRGNLHVAQVLSEQSTNKPASGRER
jgi:hypothetical protein